jgi:hypothetical protein
VRPVSPTVVLKASEDFSGDKRNPSPTATLF